MEFKYNLFHACLSIIFVFMLAAKSVHSGKLDIYAKAAQLEEYENEINLRGTLGLGSPCSSEGVEFAETSVKTFEEFTTVGTDLSLLENTLDKYIALSEKFLATGHQLCNSSKLLGCDKSTKRCNCGSLKMLNEEYKYVQRRNGDCLWDKDSPCFPVDKVPGKRNTCARNTSCLFTNVTGEKIDCDYPNFIKGTTTTNGAAVIPKCYCQRFDTTNINYPDTDRYVYYDYPSPQYTAYANNMSGYRKLNRNLFIFILFRSSSIIFS